MLMPKSILGGSTLRDPAFTHIVKVYMDDSSLLKWNEMCARAVDLFGLPGDRFITDIINGNNKYFPKGATFMEWIFREEHDALLFKLKFSEVCV